MNATYNTVFYSTPSILALITCSMTQDSCQESVDNEMGNLNIGVNSWYRKENILFWQV